MKQEPLINLEEFEEAENYWSLKLSGKLNPIKLWSDFPRGEQYEKANYEIKFKDKIVDKLLTISKANDLSIYIILLTAFKILLFKYTGQNDIILTSPVYSESNLEYNKFVVLRDTIFPRMTFKRFLMEVKQTVVDGYENEYFPLTHLIKSNKVNETFSLSTLNRIVFLSVNIHKKEFIHEIIDDYENDITFSFAKNDRGMRGRLIYNSKLFEQGTIEQFSDCYLYILEQVLDDTDIKISAVQSLTSEEKNKILLQFNKINTPVEYLPTAAPREETTIYEEFERQVEKTPNKPALTLLSDLNDIYRELASKKVNTAFFETFKKCCFKKNPYIYERVIDLPGVKEKFILLKTHHFNSVVVCRNTLKFLNCFDGSKNVESIFSLVKNLDLKFLLYSIGLEDVLEIEYGFEEIFEISIGNEFANLVRTLKVLYQNKLFEPGVSHSENSGLDNGEVEPFDNEELPGTQISLEHLLTPGKQIPKSRVLLLGDTLGMATVGLLYLASYLKRNGITCYCQLYDSNGTRTLLRKNINNLLEKVQPRVVAISMKWFLHLARVIEMCRIVKAYSPGIKIVVGGNTASYYADEIIKCEYIDFVIRGDGEVPLLEICRGAARLPNCTYKKDGKIIENPIEYVENQQNSSNIYLSHLDELLLPKYSTLLGSFFIYTYKGCGMNCFYCGGCRTANQKVFNRAGLYRRGIKEVRNDILETRKYTSTYMFDFDFPNKDLLQYCKSIWEGIDLSSHFCIFTNLIPPSPQLMEYVCQTFKYVLWNLDIASLSQRHRQELARAGQVKPQPSDEEILAFFDECEKYNNSEIKINMIAGLPGFTGEDTEAANNMISHLMNNYSYMNELHWERLYAQPGAPITADAGKYGMHSYAKTYRDFLACSTDNFNDNPHYPGVEQYDYPYISFNDEKLNAKISKNYIDTNKKIEIYKKNKQKKTTVSESVSYGELDKKVNRLAKLLRSKNVGVDNIVALILDHSMEMTIGILGVLKAGGAYLPIDPDFPDNWKKYILEDSKAEFLLTKSSLLEPVKEIIDSSVSVILLDDECLFDEDTQHLENINKSSDLAYVIYTSGTTGKPKGAAVEHNGVVNYTRWRITTNRFTADDVTLQPLSYCFDGFASNFYSSLLSGGNLLILPDSKRLDFDYIAKVIKQYRVTNVSWVPGMYEALLNVSEKEDLKSLRFMILAGEKSGENLIKRSREQAPGVLLVNEYGPTEATVTALALTHMEASNPAIMGQPISNVYIYILDASLELVPVGVPGELCISGAGVARGYMNNPELTLEKFKRAVIRHSSLVIGESKRAVISHSSLVISTSEKLSKVTNDQCPMTNDRSQTFLPNDQWPMTNDRSYKLYKTGDLARWLSDGNVEFLGRTDHQVKIRGFRIEPGEIESQLLKYHGIKETIVLIKEKNEDKRLYAYIVSDEEPEIPGLREFLLKKLPDYMVPVKFVQLEKMPLTKNGKIDREALLSIEETAAGEYVAPQNEMEKKLVKIWADVLELKEDIIGLNSHFFELGGHSLKAIILITKIHKAFDVKVTLAEVFKNSTVKGLIQCIGQLKKETFDSIVKAKEKEYYDLSPAQKRLYILQQIDPQSITYNAQKIVEPGANVEKKKLEDTFKKLIKRHESLRTAFVMIGGKPVQKIYKDVDFAIDFYGDEDSDGEHIVREFIRPFDFNRAPLLRVGLIQIGKERHLLVVDLHHIIADGVSFNILVQEFTSLYDGVRLPPLKLQYRDYSEWLNSEDQKRAVKQQEKYWLKEFEEEISILNLPTDYVRPTVQDFSGARFRFNISGEETKIVERVCLEKNVTPFMFLLAVNYIFLSKLTGQEDIIIGTPTAGRRHADLEKIIGMFVNTLALRNRPKPGLTFVEFLQEVKAKTLEAFENQDYPFEDLVEKVSLNRDTSRNPLFDTMFVMQNLGEEPGENPGTPDTDGRTYSLKPENAKFDLTLFGAVNKGRLLFSFEYSTSLFKKVTIERFVVYLKKIVSEVAANPDVKICDLEILLAEEKTQVLYEFNNPTSNYPKDKVLHQLFEEQLIKVVDHIAVVGTGRGKEGFHPANGEQHISYGHLNRKANQLAYLLMGKGIKPGFIIGILVERSLDMIVGILAILKAGGAYLPLNPQNPETRNRYMINDSNVGLLLSHRGLGEKFHQVCDVLNLEEKNLYHDNTQMAGLEAAAAGRCNDLVYIIYTSGSTGNPKGVPITHANLSPLLHWGYKHLGICPGDRVIQNLSYFFDWSVWEIFITLNLGANLFMISEEILLNPEWQVDFINQNKITVLHITPTHYQYLVKVGRRLETLKWLFIGAEKLTWDLVSRTIELVNDDCQIFNMYGPTEATIISSVLEIDRSDEGKYKELASVPIGKTIGNTGLLVLNRHLQLCPINVEGELYIAGDALAKGYLNSPAKSSQAFVKNVFKDIKGDRLYKTGDRVRWLPDGNIEFLGRIDHQVKIRGYRIELGEIENQLLQDREVKEAVVLDRKDQTGDKYLCAYIVSHTKPDAEQLTTHLSRKLPAYMIPSYFFHMDSIPLTPNGKINRKALPEPEVEGDVYEAPRSAAEKKMAEIWSEVLNVEKEKISITANFFQLGGHSLKATIMASKIQKEFDTRLPLIEIFKTPNLEKLVELVQGEEKGIFTLTDDNLVLLRKKSPEASHLFFIHDGSGEVGGYIEFCRRLDSGFNCWGIQADSFENYSPQNLMVEDIARKYIEKIKKIQPPGHGPYYIAGWSLGGTIAFEIVRQLEQMGEKIGFLAMIDTLAPRVHQERTPGKFDIQSELNFIRNYLQNPEIEDQLENVTEIEQIWLKTVRCLGQNRFDIDLIKKVITEYEALVVPNYDHLTVGQLITYMNRSRTLINARAHYIPAERIYAPVYHFIATQSKKRIKDGWKDYCQQPVKFYEIPGNHFSIFKKPDVETFAKRFSQEINRVVHN